MGREKGWARWEVGISMLALSGLQHWLLPLHLTLKVEKAIHLSEKGLDKGDCLTSVSAGLNACSWSTSPPPGPLGNKMLFRDQSTLLIVQSIGSKKK